MPLKKQTNYYPGLNTATLTALSYGALESLGWTIRYGTDAALVAFTPRKWNKHEHQVDIESAEGQVTLTAKHIHGELADLPGRNKKFLEEFFLAFEHTKDNSSDEQIRVWKEKLEGLEKETVKVVEQELKDAAEVDKAMNLSGSKLYLTYGIMGINLVVFIMMCISGVSIMTPTGIDIIKWGGNHPYFTLSGDWWRLITCVFVHIGIIHIVFNMYALYMIGVYLEPMLGKARFIAAYLATGICASTASLVWHNEPITSAGASGAIFGMYGIFLALLSTKLIPKQVRDQLLKSIIIFIGYNIIYGMKSGVDNAAHIGGLISGLVIGYIFYLGWKGENAGRKKIVFAVAVLFASLLVAYFYIDSNKVSGVERRQLNNAIAGMKYRDSQKFMEKVEKFSHNEDRALAPLRDTTLTYDQLAEEIDQTIIPEWNAAEAVVEDMKTYDVSDPDKRKITLLDEYVQLRKQHAFLLKEYIRNRTKENEESLAAVNSKIENIIRQLSGL